MKPWHIAAAAAAGVVAFAWWTRRIPGQRVSTPRGTATVLNPRGGGSFLGFEYTKVKLDGSDLPSYYRAAELGPA